MQLLTFPTETPQGCCKMLKGCCLQGFWAHGNLLTSLPDNFGQLSELHTISLAGNCLTALPSSVSGLTKLQDFGLQGNQLTEARAELGCMSKCHSSENHTVRMVLQGTCNSTCPFMFTALMTLFCHLSAIRLSDRGSTCKDL